MGIGQSSALTREPSDQTIRVREHPNEPRRALQVGRATDRVCYSVHSWVSRALMEL